MTGGSPTSGADPPPIRCSIRSVIRTFWRARARLHAPDADDASGGRRCLAARYGEKRGGHETPPRFSPYAAPSLRSLSPCGPPPSPSSRFRGRSLPPCPVVGACTAAVGGRCPSGGALPQWGAHCRSGRRTAAVGGALRAVAVALPAPRAAPPPSPPRAPAECSLHAGGRGLGRARFRRSRTTACAAPGGASRGRPDPAIGMARFRRSWGVWRGPGGACGGATTAMPGDRSASVGVGRRRSAQRSDEQCRRCGGARAVRGGRGGVKAGWRRPDRRRRRPWHHRGRRRRRGRPPHAGDGGDVGKGADRRAWGVGRGPGGAGGCAVVIPWRGFRCFTQRKSTGSF